MSIHLLRDLEHLKRELLRMGSMVEEATNKAILALIEHRPELAEEVMDGDERIDDQEVRTEEECLKILALHQPVAKDLRFIIAVMKVNNELEHMGDKACSIAKHARYLALQPPVPIPLDLTGMCGKVRLMVRDCLNALIEEDAEKAKSVCLRDQEIDDWRKSMTETLRELIVEDTSSADLAFVLLSVVRHLERIADFACSIAEDIVFMSEGSIIRHHL